MSENTFKGRLESEELLAEDKTLLWNLLNLHNTNRIDYNNRKWETVKFFQTIISALLGGAVGAIISADDALPLVNRPIMILPTLAFLSAGFAILNLFRESEWLKREEIQMFKLARALGLDVEISHEKRWFGADKYLLMQKWRLSDNERERNKAASKPLDAWITGQVWRHEFFVILLVLFTFQAGVAGYLFYILARAGAKLAT